MAIWLRAPTPVVLEPTPIVMFLFPVVIIVPEPSPIATLRVPSVRAYRELTPMLVLYWAAPVIPVGGVPDSRMLSVASATTSVKPERVLAPKAGEISGLINIHCPDTSCTTTYVSPAPISPPTRAAEPDELFTLICMGPKPETSKVVGPEFVPVLFRNVIVVPRPTAVRAGEGVNTRASVVPVVDPPIL